VLLASGAEELGRQGAGTFDVDTRSFVRIDEWLSTPGARVLKRMLDLAAATILGILLLPVLFTIAMVVKFTSCGPVFYASERVGRDGRRFNCWKFRTMVQDAHDVLHAVIQANPRLRDEWESSTKLQKDPRITRFGVFLRITSLDELPQIWNVIRGDMSLVGPRPMLCAEVEKYGPHLPLYTRLTPGITGLWQVSGRNNTSYERRIELNNFYARNWSPWLDAHILARTIKVVLFQEGAY
jgi:Undecaprenyl-phosphate galactose phosphotransferase WbaP